MRWHRTFLPTSSGVHRAHPFSEKWGCGYNRHHSRNAESIPTWVPSVGPACHLSQIRLTQASDPQHWVCGNSRSGLGNKELMLFIYLEMGSFQ